MADDSKNKAVKEANRPKLNFKGWVGVFAGIGLAILTLVGVWLLIPNTLSFSGDLPGYSEKAGVRQVRHIITSIKPARLNHWNDANADGRVQRIEVRYVEVPAGCYTFTASDTRTRLSNDPEGPFHDLGSILLINGKLRNEMLQIEKAGPLNTSYYPFGTTEYPRVVGRFQIMHVGILPTDCPEPEE